LSDLLHLELGFLPERDRSEQAAVEFLIGAVFRYWQFPSPPPGGRRCLMR
jgi:hypothetical protein